MNEYVTWLDLLLLIWFVIIVGFISFKIGYYSDKIKSWLKRRQRR